MTALGRISSAWGRLALGVFVLCALPPHEVWACACGCNVFDVGSSAQLPKESESGGSVYFEWDHANQNTNWNGLSKAPAANNSDKRILTDWYVAGFQYMFNRDWGIQARLPYAARSFTTQLDDGSLPTYRVSDFADLQITGVYTGFSRDLSTGLIFGLKLPTGNFAAKGFDRDTQLGSGSTDLILGVFHRGMITGDNAWQYFGQIKWAEPIATQSAFDEDAGRSLDYRPGSYIDGSFGIAYNNWYHVGPFDKIAPMLQIVGLHHQPDSGGAAMPDDTGYDRLLIAPGVEFTKVLDDPENKTLKVYGDVEIPVYQRANGNQLVSPALFRIVTAFTF